MKKVLVIGGGLSGIGAAIALRKSGVEYELHEESDRLGGKLRSDVVDGFTLDRGFQVFFEAYKKDMPRLDIKYGTFKSGAMLCYDGQLEPIDKYQPLVTLLSPAFGLKDKLLTLKLSVDAAKLIDSPPDVSILEFCESYGFSDRFIERFAKPFWGGITLDRGLGQHAKKLIQSWHHLSLGPAMLPELGMQQIPSELAKDLKSVHLNSKVDDIRQNRDGFEVKINGSSRHFDEIISSKPWNENDDVPWLSSCAIWFRAPKLPLWDPFLILNSDPEAFVNTVAPMSLAQPSYAPRGVQLVCAAVLGADSMQDAEIVDRAKTDLSKMFPKEDIERWEMIRVDNISNAQVSEIPNVEYRPSNPPGFHLIGERMTGSRINFAVVNGISTGEKVAHG